MNEQQIAYRQIMKATSIFGGVQVIKIIITIVRSKFIAILLGPSGMGIANLLASTTGLIGGLTNFGIGTSAVKDVAAANARGNPIRLSIIIIVLRRWVWITGTLGALVTLLCAPWLSNLTFGNSDYTLAFVWISITLLFNQLSSGQLAVLQGIQQLNYLAKSSVFGSLLGLLINIPLYYLYGINGIVPAIIIASVLSLLVSWFYAHKVKIKELKVSRIRTLAEGKNMLYMGFAIALNGLILLGTSYIVRIYISARGGLSDVGLYSAGFAIINTYVGMFFTAMTTDFYPRLSAIAHDNTLCKQTINQQADIAILILAPIMMLFLVFINWIIVILYSNKFLAINDMVLWAALGIYFKAASWPVGFIFIPKGDSRTFIISELIANTYMLLINLLGYHYFGLKGLGFSFFIAYMLYFIQVFLITNLKYEFKYNAAFIRIFFFQFLFAIVCFIEVKLLNHPYSYILGSILIVISSWYSYKELDKRLGVMNMVRGFRDKLLSR
jgi:O-antigen/teichoic acid export membrane protein